ncbi:GNAT family N-acetyltransferase [Tepidamorphus sp. 3E244]|uniref:GNAT family N-acetyltransferase n=1 Tax=Tepidamorphus sp. 3E244 TaxID=3385498 RepID=UPI0038FC1A4E
MKLPRCTITTSMLVLRPLRRGTAWSTFHWTENTEALDAMEMSAPAWSRWRWYKVIRAYTGPSFITHEIWRRADNKLIGLHIAHVEGGRIAKLAIIIPDPADRGANIAEEARAVVIDLLFDRTPVKIVHGTVAARNFASAFLYQKLGFRQDAILKGRLLTDNGRIDKLVFSLLPDEWAANRPPLPKGTVT